MRRSILLSGVALMLASCSYVKAKPPEGVASVKPDLTFSHVDARPLAVDDVRYLDKTKHTDYGAHEGFVQSLALKDDVYDALANYFRKSFISRGAGQSLEIHLEHMHETVRFEDNENYLFKVTDINRKEHVDVTFTILMQLVYPHGGMGKGVRLNFTKKLVFDESVSLNQREAEYTRFTESLLHDVDKEVMSAVQDVLGL